MAEEIAEMEVPELVEKPTGQMAFLKKVDEERFVEAALFMSPKAITLRELSRHTGIKDLGLLQKCILRLIQRYSETDSALEVIFERGIAAMRVREPYNAMVAHLAASSQFNKGIMKTLAVIAYKQPITQSQLVRFRTSKAYDDVKALEERGFVQKIPSGRTFALKTTKRFSQMFDKKQNTENQPKQTNGFE
ncbi:MAG: SMC-Scp complex subunit ScpB [archaeon]